MSLENKRNAARKYLTLISTYFGITTILAYILHHVINIKTNLRYIRLYKAQIDEKQMNGATTGL